jgi:hypothetical protein
MSMDERVRETAMANAKHDSIRALVDVKHGLVSRELFVNDDIYLREQEQVVTSAGIGRNDHGTGRLSDLRRRHAHHRTR